MEQARGHYWLQPYLDLPQLELDLPLVVSHLVRNLLNGAQRRPHVAVGSRSTEKATDHRSVGATAQCAFSNCEIKRLKRRWSAQNFIQHAR